jgi:hypothetical protein
MKTYYLYKIWLFILPILISFSVLLLSGCGGGRVPPEGLPKLYPCSILVTQEGEPLVGATVSLHSTSEKFQWTINGRTDESGKAEIMTHGYFKGVPAGNFKVTVDKLETVVPPLPEVMPTKESELTKLFNKIEEETKEYQLVDIRYTQAESTPLSITVSNKMENISFDVGSANTRNSL